MANKATLFFTIFMICAIDSLCFGKVSISLKDCLLDYSACADVDIESSQAEEAYARGCKGKDFYSCFRLGQFYEIKKKDLKKASEFFKISCDGKDKYGCEALNLAPQSTFEFSTDCEKAHLLKGSLNEASVPSWFSADEKNYIIYDKTTTSFYACYKQNKYSYKLDGIKSDNDDSQVEIKKGFTEFNNDGKVYFISYLGQCVEGPCQGKHYLYSIKDQNIFLEKELNADDVDFLDGKDAKGLILTKYCFTSDWQVSFSWVSFMKFEKDKGLVSLRYRDVKLLFPDQYSRLTEQSSENLTKQVKLIESNNGMDDKSKAAAKLKLQAQSKVYQMFISAYKGEPYKRIEKKYGTVELDGYCNPLEIARGISENY